MTVRTLPDAITSHDLLKFVAVLIMVVDHVGYFLFPEQEWWRAVGRIGFPVWFFLVGYANGRDVSARLLLWASSLLVANFIVGIGLVPLNALFTIIFMRLLLDTLVQRTFKDVESLVMSNAVLLALVVPTFLITEYGTEALIAGMFGYAVRHRPMLEAGGRGRRVIPAFYAALLFSSFIVMQQFIFQFTIAPQIFMIGGTLVVVAILYYFRSQSYPRLTSALPAPLTWLIQLGGRRTMEIYVIHLFILKVANAYLYPGNADWFHLVILDPHLFGDPNAVPAEALVEPKTQP